ncbi:uncharacterized protein PHACADRAFT_266317 [Phanerochaete carnosa HHB-10118-sp]|uniref:Secreted protein n=1 Tax=Phanerochaete carnosa (strain HHB-10118-sp) TaxID=650164 RepID=K5VP70_PHACS|nr:uncharacterized protein PHACADRAFT_266317 [Phanerochaete carnosa HHB-10118-sp]EKM48515.1 hypothetical protein PHACADRAFT_266317 [Phanerochaete carnosa HHB-10118-sp]
MAKLLCCFTSFVLQMLANKIFPTTTNSTVDELSTLRQATGKSGHCSTCPRSTSGNQVVHHNCQKYRDSTDVRKVEEASPPHSTVCWVDIHEIIHTRQKTTGESTV